MKAGLFDLGQVILQQLPHHAVEQKLGIQMESMTKQSFCCSAGRPLSFVPKQSTLIIQRSGRGQCGGLEGRS